MAKILRNLEDKRQNDLTVDEVRAYPMFSTYSEEQARELIRTVIAFTRIVFGIFTGKTNLNTL